RDAIRPALSPQYFRCVLSPLAKKLRLSATLGTWRAKGAKSGAIAARFDAPTSGRPQANDPSWPAPRDNIGRTRAGQGNRRNRPGHRRASGIALGRRLPTGPPAAAQPMATKGLSRGFSGQSPMADCRVAWRDSTWAQAAGPSRAADRWSASMTRPPLWFGLLASLAIGVATSPPAAAQQQQAKPNILFIMGDDIGWMQPSIYHQGLMVGETPNIDRIGQEGARFMHYYAEESCTAGRNAFFTGMHPLRTGM